MMRLNGRYGGGRGEVALSWFCVIRASGEFVVIGGGDVWGKASGGPRSQMARYGWKCAVHVLYILNGAFSRQSVFEKNGFPLI